MRGRGLGVKLLNKSDNQAKLIQSFQQKKRKKEKWKKNVYYPDGYTSFFPTRHCFQLLYDCVKHQVLFYAQIISWQKEGKEEFTTLQDERHQRKRKLKKKKAKKLTVYKSCTCIQPIRIWSETISAPLLYDTTPNTNIFVSRNFGAFFFLSAHKVIVTHAFRINTSFFLGGLSWFKGVSPLLFASC